MRSLEGLRVGIEVVAIMIVLVLIAPPAAAIHPGTWEARADLPDSVESPSVELVNGMVYAIGGLLSDGVADSVFVYDPTTDSWDSEAATAMPTPRAWTASAVVDDMIYMIGGSVDDTGQGSTGLVEVYDPATDIWETRSPMPTARWSPAAAVIADKIYVFGGGTGSFTGGWTSQSAVEVYDPASDSWTTATDMPTARDTVAAVALDGLIYVAGGTTGTAASSLLEIYDPATDTWTSGASMHFRRDLIALAVVDDLIYAFGGIHWTANSNWVWPREAEVYDPSTDTWQLTTRMPETKCGTTPIVVDGSVFLVAGYSNHDGLVNHVDAYDPDTYTWWTESAAHLTGLHGSQWRTDLSLANLETDPAEVEIRLHVEPGSQSSLLDETIDSHQQMAIEDVVAAMGAEGKAVLSVQSDRHLHLNGRLYSAESSGTFGQFSRFQTMDDGFVAGDVVYLCGLRQSQGSFRSNMMVANTGIREASLMVTLFACSGDSLATFLVAGLQPGDFDQRVEVLANEGHNSDVGWGYAKITVLEGAGVMISASVIDSRTNDATTITAER